MQEEWLRIISISKVRVDEKERLIMDRRMLTILFLSLLATSAWGQYGALAVDGTHGSRWGTSAEYSTQSAADQRALNKCGGGCRVVVRVQNQCGAYAADQASGSSVAGWAMEPNQASADNLALWECRNRGGRSCQIRVRACSLAKQPAGRPQRIDPD
jgi:hypothetical protein